MPSTTIPQAPVVPIKPPQVGEGGYQGLNPHDEVLPTGWKYPHPNARPLPAPILVEHDVPLTMRDGVTLRADIYRPPGAGSGDTAALVPAILAWSPFGKKFNGLMSLDLMVPWSLGIAPGTLSGLEKFEGPDPADYVPRGYAVVNIDTRGTGDSDGVMGFLGTQEAEDGYDTIEALARLPWCSGAVGMAGNSHLAIAQWFIAAQRPPSLRAIAPWEGCGDLYREQFGRGGVYGGDMFDKLIVAHMLRGRHGVESFREKFRQQPLVDAWWADKRPDMRRISVPAYLTGTWTNTMHGMGVIRAWRELQTGQKWLRWHGTQEWYDLYGNQAGKQELLSFFDRFLKGVANDWEATPRIRYAALRFGTQDPIENLVSETFPPEEAKNTALFLAADGKLVGAAPPSETTNISYDSQNDESVSFTHVFDRTTRMLGISKAVLYMSCDDANDLDVHVFIEKLDAQGRPMTNLNIPWAAAPVTSTDEIAPRDASEVVVYKGPSGVLRASHRAVDAARSTLHPNWPFHPHDAEDKIVPGTVVRLDVGIWATGIQYEAGEALRVVVGGRYRGVSHFGTSEHTINRGRHKLLLGKDHPSQVILPLLEVEG